VTNVGSDRSQLARVAKEPKAALQADSLEAVADCGMSLEDISTGGSKSRSGTATRSGAARSCRTRAYPTDQKFAGACQSTGSQPSNLEPHTQWLPRHNQMEIPMSLLRRTFTGALLCTTVGDTLPSPRVRVGR
jgi:hypothetical protein